jgi:DNA-binding NarL/FixJ family response regulator
MPTLSRHHLADCRDEGIRIVVADDHVALRRCVCRLLSETPGIEIVGQAADGQEAVRLARELSPHMVLMDVNMPRVDGIEATRQIVRDCPDVRVVAVSADWSRTTATSMLGAGASGCVAKAGVFDALLEAIRVVRAGGQYLCSEVASVLGNCRAVI